MADLSNTKDITTVDSTPSVAITDKIYINKGGKLQQVSLATAIESKIDSSLSKSKFAADAKATKDAISKVDSDIKAQNPISETIFSNTVTFSPTAYGNAIPEQIEGYIKQDTTKGLQLFDAKTVLSSQIQSKVLTCNNDGSVTLDGEITGSNRNFTIQLSAGTYYFNEKDKIFHTLVNGDDLWNKPYTFETDTTIKCYIANGEYGNKKIYPMINKGDSPLSIEPYTGGQPSPNPDYPQIVHGVGDMGFFDGELLQGYYQASDGTFKPATVALCNKNPIPCKPGDKIIFEYEDVINGSGITIFFYKSDGTFISRVNKVGVRKIEGVAPQDTTYCNIVINPVSDPIPVASAKHITVTINDKYAVCVKSKGKNLLNLTGEILYSFGRETIFDNQVTIRPTTDGRSAPGVWFVLGDIKKFLGKTIYVKADAIQRSGNYNPRMLLMTIKGNTSVRTYLTYSYSKAGQVMSVKIPDDLDTNEASDLALNMYVNDGSSQVDADAYAIFTNVYAGLSEPTNEFVPYQSNVTYIPVDYPLFEGDKIVRRNGEYKLLRKWKQEVFDGSEDEGWVQGKSNTNQFYTSQYKEKKVNADIVSNRFKHATSVEPPSIWIGNDINIYFESGYLDNNTIAGFQEWLQENPVSCVYELATPTEEPLSSEAMKTLYSIMACDEETELTIVGVPSDAEIQNQFLLPRNEDGALNTTAYCTAKRNEIALEELENATAARLSALETQALQEV
ncbi:MAG: hypothetical protein ACLVDR_04795 [Sellimonas intestinalis]|uniref:hypothetical protein n=1 Tax=Sellimonas intestinalis TaxID=1653434 RepID=UPI00399A3DB1